MCIAGKIFFRLAVQVPADGCQIGARDDDGPARRTIDGKLKARGLRTGDLDGKARPQQQRRKRTPFRVRKRRLREDVDAERLHWRCYFFAAVSLGRKEAKDSRSSRSATRLLARSSDSNCPASVHQPSMMLC